MKKSETMIAVLLTLMLVASALFATITVANAATVEIETNAYVMLSPDPIGVGQTLLVSYRIDKLRAGAVDYAGHFEGFSVTITLPDGSVDEKTDLAVDSTSGGWFTYVPMQTGVYTFQTHFPAQWSNGTSATGPYNYLYLASDSSVVQLTVQADPIEPIPNNPLPEGSWTRPINSENKNWNTIADNWLMRCYDHPNRGFCVTTAFSPYTSAPESSHILWAKPIIFGGEAGGKFADASYYTGLSYEQFYTPLILEGRIIYTEHGPTNTAAYGTRILDLYTGEEIMFLDGIDIMFAQTIEIDNPNEHGLLSYLWAQAPGSTTTNATLLMFDGFTGRQILTVTNVTWGALGGFNGGPTTFGPKGEILSYAFSADRTHLTCWNSTKAIISRVGIDVWSPAYQSIIDGSRGIEYDVSVPAVAGNTISTTGEGYILAMARDQSEWPWVETHTCYDAATGSVVWTKQRTEIYTAFFGPNVMSIRDGMYVERDEGKMVCYAYDIKTGDMLWVSDPLPNGWGIFEYQRDIAYGKVYTTGYTGSVWAYDASNGDLAWEYDMGSAGYETVYGVWPTYNGFTIADHKIFVSNDEHSPDSVLWRGSKLYAINTDNGELSWSIAGMMRNPVVADGMLTALNSYDGQVYTFGKGPSATTVTTPDVAVATGAKIVIKGTVTDQSPGQPGTPAISDDSMSAWMEYLYMQRPIPGDATGVPVKLTAIAPNGASETIGTATSDMAGNYAIEWKPTQEGLYQIMATFEGSNSYDSSYATAYVSVGSAVSPSTTTDAPTGSPVGPSAGADTTLYVGIAAIVVIVVIAVSALYLRRRK